MKPRQSRKSRTARGPGGQEGGKAGRREGGRRTSGASEVKPVSTEARRMKPESV